VQAEEVHIVDAESLSMLMVVGTWLNPTDKLLQLSDVFEQIGALCGALFSVCIAVFLALISVMVTIHKSANNAVVNDPNVCGTFAFLYCFPWLVKYTIPWAPPWAPICLWYCFLVQVFCTSGPPRMVQMSRIIVPLMFLAEGVSYHSFLLDLTGGELLTIAYVLAAVRSVRINNVIFILTLSFQVLLSVFVGDTFFGHWFQFVLGICSILVIRTASVNEDTDVTIGVDTKRFDAKVPMEILGGSKPMEVNETQKEFVKSVLSNNNTDTNNNGNRNRSGNGTYDGKKNDGKRNGIRQRRK